MVPDIEVVEVEAELSNPHDSMATAVKRNRDVLGHVPRSLAHFTHFSSSKKQLDNVQSDWMPLESWCWSRARGSVSVLLRGTPEIYKEAAGLTDIVKYCFEPFC